MDREEELLANTRNCGDQLVDGFALNGQGQKTRFAVQNALFS